MQFSSRTAIAAHILLCITEFEGQHKLTSEFLASSVNVNPVIIRKVLGQLKAAGLVAVEAGVGGASAARPLDDITLLDVFDAVENADEELFSFHENPNPQCEVGRNVHKVLDTRLRSAQTAMRDSLREAKLSTLAAEMHSAIALEKGK